MWETYLGEIPEICLKKNGFALVRKRIMKNKIKKKRNLVINLFMTLFIWMLMSCQIFAQPAGGAGSGQHTMEEGKYADTRPVAYLRISLEKDGRLYTNASLNVYTPVISLLEYTDWKLKAEYVVIKNGKTTIKNVTSACNWNSSDESYSHVRVMNSESRKGILYIDSSDSNVYNVAATYMGYDIVNGEAVLVAYTAKLGFRSEKLKLANDSTAMSALAFNQLTMTCWDTLEPAPDTSISLLAYNMMKNWDKQYILQRGTKGSATIGHLYDSAIGDATLLFCWKSKDDPLLRAAVYKKKNVYYISYQYMADEASKGREVIFKSALSLYSTVAKNGITIVTGAGMGGTCASYVSYARGCEAYTFQSKNCTTYATLYGFEDFCKYYNNALRVNYLFPTKEEQYLRDPYYTVIRSNSNITTGLLPMITYNKETESVSFARSSLNYANRQTIWYRSFYFGGSSAERFELNTYNKNVLFGGNGNDTLTIKAPDSNGDLINEALSAGSILYSALPLPGIASDIRDVSSIAFNTEFNIATGNNSFGGVAIDTGLLVMGKVLGVYGVNTNPLSMVKLIYDTGVFLAQHFYPSNNIFVGGKGSDTMHGTAATDWYVYTKGDGYDQIYDGYGQTVDCIYLMGVSEKSVKFDFSAASKNMLRILIDGEKAIDFHIANTGVAVFFGNPFKNPGEAYCFTKQFIQQIAEAYQIACPVDVLVYDGKGKLVKTLKDGVETKSQEKYGLFEVAKVKNEYMKSVVLYDASYSIVIKGNGNGTMSYVAGYFNKDGSLSKYGLLENIPVKKGELFHPNKKKKDVLLDVDQNGDGTIDQSLGNNTKISIQEKDLSLAYGKTAQLHVDYKTNSVMKSYAWVSSDPKIVEVNDQGAITAVGFGEAQIKVIALDGTNASAICKVKVPEKKLNASDFTVKGLKSTYDYTGKPISVSLEVRYQSVLLKENMDYIATFSELTEPGAAVLTIEGIGKYSGRKTISYTIKPPVQYTKASEKVKYIASLCRAEKISGEYDIAVWLHDYLITHATYDFTYTYYSEDGVLLHGTGVCSSYSKAYALLLKEFGIENEILEAPEMDHAWNLVKLEGKWCHIDCTWDDPGDGGAENYNYFGMNDALISRDHKWNTSKYRKTSSLDNYYYKRKGYKVFQTKEEQIKVLEDAAKQKAASLQMCYIGNQAEYSILAVAEEWINRYNWKYGICEYQIEGDFTSAEVKLKYDAPWEEPAEFTGSVKCPSFKLAGPKGIYSLKNYEENGIILIFGQEGCLNTMGLLDSLNSRLKDLRKHGVEVILNISDASTEKDMATYTAKYPDFVYTYGDSILICELLDLVNVEDIQALNTPFVFFINKHGMITYFTSGWVKDINAFIGNAMNENSATENALPKPDPVNPDYYGGYFNYTGNDSALKKVIQEQINEKSYVIAIRDSSENLTDSYWNHFVLGGLMLDNISKARKNVCDYQIPEYYSIEWESHIIYCYMKYDCHNETIDSAVAPTCTKDGYTQGSHCSVCKKVLKKQVLISANGHNMSYIPEVPATCTKDGKIAYYHCKDCGKDYIDDAGDTLVSGTKVIPKTHHYTSFASNENGTHVAVCEYNKSHKATKNCEYTYTKLQDATDTEREKGVYTCIYCKYTFLVERKSVAAKTVKLSKNTYTYDGKEKCPTVTISGLKAGTDFKVTYSNNINAGTATVIIKGIGNYGGTLERKFEIAKAKPTISLAAKTVTYNGSAQNASAKVVPSTIKKITYTYYTDSACTAKTTSANSGSKTSGSAPKYAGTYYVKASISETENYKAVKSKAVKFIIRKAASTITLADKTSTYSGKAISIGTPKVTGSTGKVSITYYVDSSCKTKTTTANSGASTAGGAPKKVGTYYAKATVAADRNCNLASSKVKKLVINKAVPTIKVKTTEKSYTVSDVKSAAKTFEIGATITGSGKMTYEKVSGSSVLKLDKKTGKVTVEKKAAKGTYQIKIKISAEATSSYKAASKTVTITVNVK